MVNIEPYANIAAKPRCFNHDIMSCTHEEVEGNHLYSGRALGLTRPGDVIQLHPALENECNSIARHYDRIGLSHTDTVVWDVGPDELARHTDMEPSVFFFGPDENMACPDPNWHSAVEYINSKNNFMALASHLRIPVPDTVCFRGKQWVRRIDKLTYPCYVKAAISVAGKGIFRCASPDEIIHALAHFAEDIPIQIQAEVDSPTFLNMQYEVVNRRLQRLLVTEQILEGYTHLGNRHPACHEPWDVVDSMAQWLFEKGIQGIFAFDVAVMNPGDSAQFLVIECNPRFNGASYPTGIALKLGLNNWTAKEFITRHRHLADIDLSELEYDPRTQTGIVIINWGTVLIGKISVLITGTDNMQAELEAKLRSRL